MEMPYKSFGKTFFLLLVCGSSQAQAQAQAPLPNQVDSSENAKTEGVPQVLVKGQTVSELSRDEALSRSIIDNTALTKFGASNFVDALRHVSGVLVIGDQVQLSGLDGRYTQILIDGSPPRGVSISDLPVSLIERLEIYRQGNAQFSAQAIGGTINIVLKKIPKTSQNQIKLSTSYAYRPTFNFDWLRSMKEGKLSRSFSISGGENGAQSSMPIYTATTVRDHRGNAVQQYSQFVSRSADNAFLRFSPRFQYKYSESTEFIVSSTVSATHRKAKQNERYDFFVGDTLPVGSFRQSASSRNYLGNVTLQAKSDFKSGLKFEAGLTLDGARFLNDSVDNTLDSVNEPLFVRDRQVLSHKHGLSSTGKITFPILAGHELVAGWDASVKRSKWQRLQQQRGLISDPFDGNQETDSEIRKLDFYVQDEWKIKSNTSAYLGARIETVTIRATESPVFSDSSRASVLSPVAQILYQLDEKNSQRLRFGLSRAYKSPTDDQLLAPRWTNINNTINTPNLRGNPDLRPELSWAFDGGYELNRENGLNLTILTKFRKIDNLIQDSLAFSEGAWWLSYVNAGRATSKSVEIESQFPLKALYDSDQKVDFSFGFSKTLSNVSSLSPPFNNLSPIDFSANIGIDYEAKVRPLSAGLSASYTRTQWHRENSNKFQHLDVPLDLSMYVSWKFPRGTKLRFSAENLLRREFILQNLSDYEAGTSAYRFFSPAYRRFSFSLEMKL